MNIYSNTFSFRTLIFESRKNLCPTPNEIILTDATTAYLPNSKLYNIFFSIYGFLFLSPNTKLFYQIFGSPFLHYHEICEQKQH